MKTKQKQKQKCKNSTHTHKGEINLKFMQAISRLNLVSLLYYVMSVFWKPFVDVVALPSHIPITTHCAIWITCVDRIEFGIPHRYIVSALIYAVWNAMRSCGKTIQMFSYRLVSIDLFILRKNGAIQSRRFTSDWWMNKMLPLIFIIPMNSCERTL